MYHTMGLELYLQGLQSSPGKSANTLITIPKTYPDCHLHMMLIQLIDRIVSEHRQGFTKIFSSPQGRMDGDRATLETLLLVAMSGNPWGKLHACEVLEKSQPSRQWSHLVGFCLEVKR